MNDIRLKRDNLPDLIVTRPELLADVSSHEPDKDRWTELRLWRSASGRYIAEQVGKSVYRDESERCAAWICDDNK
jgi:hypothetical protein